MFITKKHLSRRTFLRGAGVTVGLPLLDAMIPAWTALAQTAASPKPRMGFMYFPHGAIMEQWTPAAEGTNFELTPILKPLEPFKKQLTIVSGLENKARHRASRACAQPGNLAERRVAAQGQEPHGGVTIDQMAAQNLGQDTPFPSLEVASRDAAERRRLRSRLWMQLRRDDFVPDALDAAAHGNRSAKAVPAAVRPGRHAAGAQGDRETVFEHSRSGDRRSRGSPRRLWARRIAPCSTTIWKPFAKSSAACRRWKHGI